MSGETERSETPSRVAGRIAVVTGGGKGVGRRIAIELARAGADVAIVAGRDVASAEEVAAAVRETGRRALPVAADITDPAAVETAMDEIENRLGPIGLLVNNAGRTAHAAIERLSVEDWDAVFAVNAKGTFLCATAAARRMIPRGAGVIVNIAGASAHRSYVGGGAYGPSKAAVVNLTTQMALEWAKYGIRVNGVSPGPIRDEGSGWETLEPELAESVQRIPLRRPVSTEDVARAVVFLASDEARSITGQMLIVDAGSSITWYMTD